jgi:hypothetical protein
MFGLDPELKSCLLAWRGERLAVAKVPVKPVRL